LYSTPYPARGVVIPRFIGTAHDPVEYVEETVCAESDKVEGVDDGRHSCLPQEKQLGNHTDRFKDLREDPEELRTVSMMNS